MTSSTRGGNRPAVSRPTKVVGSIVVGVFRREGEYWTIEYGGTLFRLRDGKGLRYLAELLRQPRLVALIARLVRQGSIE